MALNEKYNELIQAAKNMYATDLQVREQNNVLYIDGQVANGQQKDQLWDVYNKIDPDYRAGDLILNIQVAQDALSTQMRVSTKSSNLNIRKGPGTNQEIIGKAAHNSTVTFLSKYNDEWNLIRAEDGIEGYCSSEYLTSI